MTFAWINITEAIGETRNGIYQQAGNCICQPRREDNSSDNTYCENNAGNALFMQLCRHIVGNVQAAKLRVVNQYAKVTIVNTDRTIGSRRIALYFAWQLTDVT